MNLSFLLSAFQVSLVPSRFTSTFYTSAVPSNNSSMAANPLLDVLIIGGGPAGLSAATGLARQLYTAVVFDSGVYRNQLAKHMHNVLTWDHQNPADFRKKGREDILKRYATISFQDTEVKSVAKSVKGHFELEDAQGKTWKGRKLVLATGVKDVFPDIEGYGNCWARGMYVFPIPAKTLISWAVNWPRVPDRHTYALQIPLPFLPRLRRKGRFVGWRFSGRGHRLSRRVAAHGTHGQAAGAQCDHLHGRSGGASSADSTSCCGR